MAQQWDIAGPLDGPRVIDVGGEGETVSAATVALVAGRADVVTHDDSPTARLEVHAVEGPPLKVSWDGTTLKVSHRDDDGLLGKLRGLRGKRSARISLSVPSAAAVTLTTVSADGLVNGTRNDVTAATVSGELTLDDIEGNVSADTVSGGIECHAITGDLKGNSVSGSLTVQASRLRTVTLNTVSGDITIDLAEGTSHISSNSVSGDVTVRVPPGGGYDINARTASGQVVIDGQRLVPRRRGAAVEGDRSLVMEANAVSGNVVLLRATG